MKTTTADRGRRLSWFRDHLPAGQLVLDASVLINLLGCCAADEVFSALNLPCLVEEKVFGEILRHPVPGLCHMKELQALQDAGCIERARMEDQEYAKFLTLIQAPLGQRLGAGESATLVVAQQRSLSVVIDENKARSYVRMQMHQVAMVSTLRLLISATVRLGRDVSYLQGLVATARQNAKMGIAKDERQLFADVLACR
jgi:predicted nucleic acid-binding protein